VDFYPIQKTNQTSPNGGLEMLRHFHPKTVTHSSLKRGAQAMITVGLLLILGTVFALAQTASSGTIRGVVKDPSGAVVPNASVVMTSSRTGTERKASSSGDGSYVFVSIDPGTYTLTVEASGFKRYVKTDLVVSPSETKGVDVIMEIGAATESVTISAAAVEEIKTGGCQKFCVSESG